jgi:hypothetical protein
MKPVFWFCYGCIFHGTGNSAQLWQNFGISGGFEPPKPPFRYATDFSWWCLAMETVEKQCISFLAIGTVFFCTNKIHLCGISLSQHVTTTVSWTDRRPIHYSHLSTFKKFNKSAIHNKKINNVRELTQNPTLWQNKLTCATHLSGRTCVEHITSTLHRTSYHTAQNNSINNARNAALQFYSPSQGL